MNGYAGDIRLGNTIDIQFSTTDSTTGAPIALAGSPVVSAYVGNGTTQITAGITLTTSHDSLPGLNNIRVVASSGNGFATATNVTLVITTGTVDGVSVIGRVVGSFSIENRSAVMPTTAAQTLDISAGGEAGLDWANIGSPTTAQGLTGTTIATSQVVASVTGAVGSLTANNDKTGYALSATGSAALTEGYAADGATATLNQILYMIWCAVHEFAISGTTMTGKKLDGSTTAMTWTLDDATNPLTRTRAT